MKAQVLNIIRCHPEGLSEFDLMKQLDAENFFEDKTSENNSEDLLLFHKHFMLMHVLYSLQDDLSVEGVCLEVSPLKIKLAVGAENNKDVSPINSELVSRDVKLKEYYLDWKNYTLTTEKNIKDMLNSFWGRLINPEKKYNAFLVLGLPVGSSTQKIKQRYRKLAAEHHPDKGGNKDTFIKIQEAFEVLKKR
ncbi:MAG: DnaJ domain-containing protein [Cellvibrionaceae bacterium]